MDDEMWAALEADGEKLRAMTGEDHGPWQVGKAKDCPFCGHDGITQWGDGSWSGVWAWFYCEECQAQGPHVLMNRRAGETDDELSARALAAWNDRTPEPTK